MARAVGAEASDAPIAGRPERCQPGGMRRRVVECCKEGDLLDVVRVGLEEAVAGHAQFANEGDLVSLEVLEAAPHEVRRRLAGEAAEVATVDQRDVGPATCQHRSGNGPVDPSPDDQHVERSALEFRKCRASEAHGVMLQTPSSSESEAPAYFCCPIAKPLMNGFCISTKMIAGGTEAMIAASIRGPYVSEPSTFVRV